MRLRTVSRTALGVGTAACLLAAQVAHAQVPVPDDAVGEDTDGDQQLDTWTSIRDVDGEPTQLRMTDSDGDGILREPGEPVEVRFGQDGVGGYRTTQYDSDGDSFYERLDHDRDLDGNPEESISWTPDAQGGYQRESIDWDTDGDGSFDARSERRETDGEWPTLLAWNDGSSGSHIVAELPPPNGRRDPGESHVHWTDIGGAGEIVRFDHDGDQQWDEIGKDIDGVPGLDVRYTLAPDGTILTISHLDSSGEVTFTLEDVDGDGRINEIRYPGVHEEQIVVDENGNGRPDPGEERRVRLLNDDGSVAEEWVDSDGDGSWDEVRAEFDDDGTPSLVETRSPDGTTTIAYDSDGDGVIDAWKYDLDGDGEFDRFTRDRDGDGVEDVELVDSDGDGQFDTERWNLDADATAVQCQEITFDGSTFLTFTVTAGTGESVLDDGCRLELPIGPCPSADPLSISLGIAVPGGGSSGLSFGRQGAAGGGDAANQHLEAFDAGDVTALTRFYQEQAELLFADGDSPYFQNFFQGYEFITSETLGQDGVLTLYGRGDDGLAQGSFDDLVDVEYDGPLNVDLVDVDSSTVPPQTTQLNVFPVDVVGLAISPRVVALPDGSTLDVAVVASFQGGVGWGPADDPGDRCEELGTIVLHHQRASHDPVRTSEWAFFGTGEPNEWRNALARVVDDVEVELADRTT
ncbi:hypothetical protein [Serinicoccus kebangsaanensis]|uniref:hypothetical protein n=1 Tax=Serinicoccus kebangsaanensis TaxID=2602069 RepID=UPI00178C361F|nr:hypothetical protein [Serinicoccus kebangsaanensis]